MAIYSLHHQPVGKATQAKPHTAAAHVRYITRPNAASHIEGARMPVDAGKAQAYLRQMEDGDRKNARVIDKIRLALPVELDADQRAALVRGFAEELTCGRAPWLAAFHDMGKDAHNPHCHLVVRDRDHESGRRVMETSEAGSTERIRALWEVHANRALEIAGRTERVDRRTLAEQGITRTPTIHEGPRGRAMEGRGAQPTSRRRERRNGRGARSRARVVDYPAIDKGKSRSTYNRDTQAAYWAAIDADRRQREFEALGYGADARRYAARGATMDKDDDQKSKQPGFLERLGTSVQAKFEAGDRAMEKFLHDPSRPVDPNRTINVAEHHPDKGDRHYTRPMTPSEQQQMPLSEALYKKVAKPAVQKAADYLTGKGKEPAQEQPQPAAAKKPSFAEQQEQKRQELASNPDARAARDARLAERRAKERAEEKERGR